MFAAEGGKLEESGEAGGVGFEVGWELEEDGAELAGGAGGLDGGEEFSEGGAAFVEALEVGDALWSLEAEEEARRGGG